MPAYTFGTLDQFVGQALGTSGWVRVDQARIDAFAACTGDDQWIHVDPERAKRESPFGAPIAHGLLTLSLVPQMNAEVGLVPGGVSLVLNYGYDRIRFLAPVKSGSRVRGRLELLDVTPKSGGMLIKTRTTVETEGESTPALVADSLALAFPA